MSLPTPNTRKEQYLNAIATGNASGLPTPITREEEYLDAIAKSGGGGSGDGDMKKSVYDSDLAVANAGGIGAFVNSAVSYSEKDIYAVMGEMGAKNLIPYPYYEDTEEDRGITWTNNADSTITITGTATADSSHNLSQRTNTGKLYLPNGKYKLSGCPSEGSNNTYYLEAVCTKNSRAYRLGIDNGTGVDITIDGDDYGVDGAYVMVRGIVKNGYAVTNPIVFKPMLRLASDTDDTYQPYAKTNKQLTDEIANNTEAIADNTSAIEAITDVLGAKNILKYPYTDSTNAQGGLTFTDNGDGTVDVSGSETTGANVYFALENNISVTLGTKVSDIFPTAGKYTISCKNADGTNIYMGIYIADVGSFDNISEDGTDLEITNAMMSKTLRIHLEVKKDYALSSAVTLKPMIRPAGTDPTYVPYAMTNRELTERVTACNIVNSTNISAFNSASDFWLCQTDGYVYLYDSNSKVRAIGIGNNPVLLKNISGGEISLFVRKGMRLFVEDATNAYFHQLG